MLNSCSNDDMGADDQFSGPVETRAITGLTYDQAATLPVVTVSGTINSGNNHWTSSNVYALQGVVVVPDGVTLTIDAGTYIKAAPVGSGSTGVLVVTKGGKINAVGNSSNPIIFTSYNLLDGNSGTDPEPGDLGGVILLGKAPINNPTGTAYIEGLAEDPLYSYGGTVSNDDSGVMQYVRIEYAGYILGEANEINGLTMGGVGSGTTLDHIQVSWGKDDSFEWFGGTVNASYLISYCPDDDNFDCDNGYVGTITYGLALANPASTHSGFNYSTSSGTSDSNGIELDNCGTSPYDWTPKTHPTLNYITIVGTETPNYTFGVPSYKNGARIRRNGELTLTNSIITGYPNGMVLDSGTQGTTPSWSTFTNNDFHGFDTAYSPLPVPSGNTTVISTTAETFGMFAPFYPDNDFSGASEGAFALDDTWHLGWSLF